MQLAIKSWDLFMIGDSAVLYDLYRNTIDCSLLNRLFCKYVRRDDVKETRNELKKVIHSPLGLKLLEAFDDQTHCSELNLKTFCKYVPVRIVLFDEPYCTLSRDIPLEDYDNNDGEPFWMRPEYIIEKYGKNTYLQVDTITPTSYEHKATYKDGKLVKKRTDK